MLTLAFVGVAVARARSAPESARKLAADGRDRAPKIAKKLAPRFAHVGALAWLGVAADVAEPFLSERLEAATAPEAQIA